MSTTAPGARPAPVFWALSFRPFFLLAGIWSAFAIVLWVGLYLTGTTLPSHLTPLLWHTHAMLFGFVYAAVAGFMLTAIPNWTGRPGLPRPMLMTLVALWLLGRLLSLVSAMVPLAVAIAVELSFPLLLAAVAAREILAARNWRNAMMPLPVLLLGVADLLTLLEQHADSVPAGSGYRLALAAILALISLIGGRVIPIFTRNWLKKRGDNDGPPQPGAIDRLSLSTLDAGLLLWVLLPDAVATAALLLLAGLCNLWRLGRWRTARTSPEPLLLILHLGYLWIPLGVLLLGGSILFPALIPLAAAIHALTAGVIGTMTLALMTRVTLGHTGRALTADTATKLIFVLVLLSAATRVVAGFPGPAMLPLLQVSALLWAASFLLFSGTYGPMLLKPRVDR